MALRRQMDDCIRLEATHRPGQSDSVANIQLLELIIRQMRDSSDSGRIAGVGQRVDIENASATVSYQVTDQRRADKAASARHQDFSSTQLLPRLLHQYPL